MIKYAYINFTNFYCFHIIIKPYYSLSFFKKKILTKLQTLAKKEIKDLFEKQI